MLENETAVLAALRPIMEIRDKFEDIISDYEIFPIFYDHKINYFLMIRKLVEN